MYKVVKGQGTFLLNFETYYYKQYLKIILVCLVVRKGSVIKLRRTSVKKD